jgi:hypothetical protein
VRVKNVPQKVSASWKAFNATALKWNNDEWPGNSDLEYRKNRRFSMAKSKTSTSTSEDAQKNEAGGDGLPPQSPNGKHGINEFLEEEYREIIDQAKSWVEENQTMAMLGGFGLGVFLGVLLRR